jgi:uncharacterized protein
MPRRSTKLIRTRPWPALLAGLALGLAALGADAARIDGLYEAEVDVEDGRDAAFRAALGEVLVRITGRRDAAASPELEPLLQAASSYVQQFRQPAPGRLWAAFDGAALARDLARLGQPVWGAERPSTLAWVAVDAGGGQRFVVASEAELPEEAALRDELLVAARSRGLPLVLPLMDVEDRASASFAEVWGGFDDAVRSASARYGVDGILVGRLSAGDFDRGRWTFYTEDGVERWTGGLGESVERLADSYAARFVVVGSADTRPVRLAVSGIASVEDYARVSRFLAGLTAVESVGLETADGERLVFRIALRGEPATLEEAIRLGGVLRPEAGVDRGLNYRMAR